jgi:hypothetical protein
MAAGTERVEEVGATPQDKRRGKLKNGNPSGDFQRLHAVEQKRDVEQLASVQRWPMDAVGFRRAKYRAENGARDRENSASQDKAWPLFSGGNRRAQTVSGHVQGLPGSGFRS